MPDGNGWRDAYKRIRTRPPGQQLVGREAVVELDDVVGADAGLLVDLGGGGLGHLVADQGARA